MVVPMFLVLLCVFALNTIFCSLKTQLKFTRIRLCDLSDTTRFATSCQLTRFANMTSPVGLVGMNTLGDALLVGVS